MRAFQLYEGDSFLHRLNPLSKLAVALALLVVLTALGDPITPLLILAILVVSLRVLGRIGWRALIRFMAPSIVLGFGIIWTTALFYRPGPHGVGRPVLEVGPLVFLDVGVAYALTIFFRLQGFLAASLLFVLTTDPTDLMQALMQVVRLDDRFGYGTLAAYHFVPQFESELATIRAAHRIRGVADGGGPAQAVRRYVGYMIPLLAGAVRKAERVALAMDARGFGAFPDRTYYRASSFSRADWVFVVGSTLVCAGLLVGLNALGWLGRLIPPFLG